LPLLSTLRSDEVVFIAVDDEVVFEVEEEDKEVL
jgi:hypothetical protein